MKSPICSWRLNLNPAIRPARNNAQSRRSASVGSRRMRFASGNRLRLPPLRPACCRIPSPSFASSLRERASLSSPVKGEENRSLLLSACRRGYADLRACPLVGVGEVKPPAPSGSRPAAGRPASVEHRRRRRWRGGRSCRLRSLRLRLAARRRQHAGAALMRRPLGSSPAAG